MIIAIAWPISILLTAFVVWLITDSAAYQRGYKSGYDIGVAFGHKTGYQNGQLVGRQSGDAEGYERGRNDGIESEKALQAVHAETVRVLCAPAAEAAKPAKKSRFIKRTAEAKKRGDGSRAPKR